MDFIIGNYNYIAKACQRKGVILHAKSLPSHLTTEAKKTSGIGPVCCAALSGDVRLLYNLLSVTCHKPPSQRRFQMTTQLSFRFGGSVFTSHEIFRLENSTYSTLKMTRFNCPPAVSVCIGMILITMGRSSALASDALEEACI